MVNLAMMKITSVLKKLDYFALAIISTIIFIVIYIYTQLLGIIENFDVWLATIPPENGFLFTVFSVLFGITLSFQIYNWRQPKTCALNDKVKGAGSSGVGTLALFFVSQCPACASLGAIFLPLSVSVFLTQYSLPITLISIALLLFTLNYLGAFRKEGLG